MKRLGPSLILLLAFSSFVRADNPHYIKASIQVSGEFSADATITLREGKPAKIEWIDDGGPDYALIIPDVSVNNGIPNVFGMLLKKENGRDWQVITEANSLGNQFSLLGLSQDNQILNISARSISKNEFEENCENISSLGGSVKELGGGCCSASCTDGTARFISCCGGCCSDGVCGAGCCP